MISNVPPPSGPDLAAQRAALVRSIRRASLAGVLGLALVVALAGLAAWQARQSAGQAARADAEARRAAEANAAAEAQLWKARFNEARAMRIAGGPGARVHAASIVAELARDPGLGEEQLISLRSELLAQCALIDTEPARSWLAGEADVSPARGWFVRRRQGREVQMQNLADSNLVAAFSGPADAGHAHFSPSGSVLTVAFKTVPPSLLAWRVADGALLFSNVISEGALHGGDVPVFSPREEWVGVKEGAAFTVRRLSDGEVVRRRGAVPCAAFSADGLWLAVATGSGVVVEEVITGEHRARLDAGFEVTQLVWRPGSDLVGMAGRKGAVSLWQLPPPGRASGGWVRAAEGHNSGVVFAGFLHDGSALMTTGWDGFSIFWEATSGRKLLAESRQYLADLSPDDRRAVATRGFPHRTGVAELRPRQGYRVVASSTRIVPPAVGVKASRDGRWLALDHTRFSALVSAVDGREAARMRGREPEFSADGAAVFTCDGDVVRRFPLEKLVEHDSAWGPAPGEVFFRAPPGATANSISLAADGHGVFVTVAGHSVVEVEAVTGAARRSVPVSAHYARVAPAGDWLVTQMHNAAAHLVRLGSTNRLFHLGTHLNTGFDAAGRWLVAATEQRLTLLGESPTNRWAVRHRIELQTGAGAPPPFAFSPDGRLLAVVFNRFDVRLYEPETARWLATLSPAFPAQIQGVAGLVFSADGRELLAAKQDGEVVAWALPVLREELARLGLDWGGGPRPNPSPAMVRAPVGIDIWSPLAALGAALVLVAGLVVFTVQRRTLDAYARAEALAQERQRKLLEAQVALVQSQKLEALGTLAAGLAHDFNNLLSVIRMSNHFVARAVPAEGATRENVQAIEQAVAQGRDIIRSMLGYARRKDDAATEFSVPRAVADTMGMLSRQFLSGLTVSLELDPTCPAVRGSGAQLEQVLLNLVVNAAEAMNGQGRLTVSARPVSQAADLALAPAGARAYVELAVRDSGPGMAPEHLARIFEPFFTTKAGRIQPGTGLGLSVVDTIARQSGWGLGVRSRPGEGAEFVVLLPASEQGREPTV